MRNLWVTLPGMDDVAVALADPVRREILMMLRARPLPVGEIARPFPISRPAISRHLRVLRESGLVRDEPVGRRRLYTLTPEPLGELAGWIARLSAPAGWEHHLDALETEVHRTRRERATGTAGPAAGPAPHTGHERTEDTA